MFHIFLPLNRGANVVKYLKINEALEPILLGETGNNTFAMLTNAPHKIAGHADIEYAVRPIGEDVNVSRHGSIIASVDGRDKPGHDG